MIKAFSAGGVVFYNNKILLLKKVNGIWVLPKGKIEVGESKAQTAIREVYEEGRVCAEVIDYIGETHYEFSNNWTNNRMVKKTVYWYYMKSSSSKSHPLKAEGFIESKFVSLSVVMDYLKFPEEQRVVEQAINMYKEKEE